MTEVKEGKVKLSMIYSEKTQWLKDNNIDYQFGQSDIRICRKNTVCQVRSCKKKIKRGLVYFTRSFGKKWTWKACSEQCAQKMVKASVMWTV